MMMSQAPGDGVNEPNVSDNESDELDYGNKDGDESDDDVCGDSSNGE